MASPAAAKEKVTICHATASNQHPYVVNRPAEDGDVSGHAGHTGPVWFSGIDGKWGDIIPPFENGNIVFPGLNWDADGQAVWNNGCAIPNEVVIDVAPEDPTVTPATCEADGDLQLPTTANVVYSVDPVFDGPGDYTVNVSPAPGYVLVDDGDFPFAVTVDAQLTGDDCAEPVTPVTPTVDEPVAPEAVLPDTGGAPLWMLLLGGALTAGGVVLLRGARRPASATSGWGGDTGTSLALSPKAKAAPVTSVRSSLNSTTPARAFLSVQTKSDWLVLAGGVAAAVVAIFLGTRGS